ncbi:amino acid transporter heavy chain SLC3A2 [Alosa pseudoharengus]|uniref:amino acid transporter heavy chain SLC3A2 n=1 Tax=Alosa pseudoharengus TaxID=34774 RepID=UPI003F8B007F
MPLNADGDVGYGSVSAGPGTVGLPGLAGNMCGTETVPLLMPEPEPEPYRWKPLSKAELEITAGSPGWKKFRSRLVILFWLTWLAMLGASIAIIVQSPRPVAPKLRWWQKVVFYRLQPALLMDSEGGAVGGFEVMRERLPYLKSVGVGALILEGVFPKSISPSNLTEFSHNIGTMPQFQQLLKEGHHAGMKFLLDLCDVEVLEQEPANTSEGLSDSSGYVQYSLKFWLEQGISGLAICDTDAAYSEKTLMEWKALLQQFSEQDNERVLVVREMTDSFVALNVSSGGLNASLVELTTRPLLPLSAHPLSAAEMASAVEEGLQTPRTEWPSWTVGGPVSPELQRISMVLLMTLPGTPVVSDGEEVTPAEKWRSAIGLFQSLSEMRAREEALLFGSFTFLPFNASSSTSPTPPLAFLRSWGCVHFLVLLNLGTEPHALSPDWAPSLPEGGVFVTSTGMDRLGAISLEALSLRPHEAIVIKLFEGGSYS